MKTRHNIYFLLLTLLIGCRPNDGRPKTSQVKTNIILVTDSLFQKEMFDYLIPRVTSQYFDSTGRHLSVADELRDTPILLIDMKIPNIIKDTLPIGVFKVQFGCEDCEAPPELLVNYGPNHEFLNLDKGGLTDDQVINKVQQMLVSHPDRFNDSAKTIIKRNVVRLVLKDRLSYRRNAL